MILLKQIKFNMNVSTFTAIQAQCDASTLIEYRGWYMYKRP